MPFYKIFVYWVAAFSVVAWYFATDPNHGAETMVRLQSLSWVVVAAPIVYILRRAFASSARGGELMQMIRQGNIAAGIAYAGLLILVGMLFLAVSSKAFAQDRQMPEKARPLLPVVYAETLAHWPDAPMMSYVPAQIEQETCISYKHKFCWNPMATLKTSREYGFGLGQHTVAYRADGSVRFNAHQEALAKFVELEGWTWDNRFDAKFQIRASILSNKSCFNRMRRMGINDYNSLAFCDAAHNGGEGAMLNERRLCAKVAGCDQNKWFGHVEQHSVKSRVPVKGYAKSWFDINREHVKNVMIVRRPPYARWFGDTI